MSFPLSNPLQVKFIAKTLRVIFLVLLSCDNHYSNNSVAIPTVKYHSHIGSRGGARAEGCVWRQECKIIRCLMEKEENIKKKNLVQLLLNKIFLLNSCKLWLHAFVSYSCSTKLLKYNLSILDSRYEIYALYAAVIPVIIHRCTWILWVWAG